jgi:hypothetical protein
MGFHASMVAALEVAETNTAAIGARIELSTAKSVPRNLRLWLSALSYGGSRTLGPDEFVNGACFAVRRTIAEEVGGFDRALGRQNGLLISGEESLMIRKIRNLNLDVAYSHETFVTQVVPDSRLEIAFVRKRIAWESVTQEIIRRRMNYDLTSPRDSRRANYVQIAVYSVIGKMFLAMLSGKSLGSAIPLKPKSMLRRLNRTTSR